MPATIKDIAQRTRLSAMTVSRALNPDARALVAEETRTRVLAVARELGYSAHPAARALVTGRTGFVLLAVPRVAAAYYPAVVRAIERAARDGGYSLALRELPRRPAEDAALPYVDGALLWEGDAVAGEGDTGLRPRTPCIRVGPAEDDPARAPEVGLDLYPAARAAMEHLVLGGRRRIACCAGREAMERGDDPRVFAYREVMYEAGLPQVLISVDEATRAAARRSFREYVLRGDFPDAVFCQSDEIALGIHRAAHILGLAVPADLALIGCDGIEDTEYHVPAISTLQWPLEEICRVAWELLLRRIADPSAPIEPRTFAAEFVPRESSR